ncbi:hypothetical protein JTB14_034811 [Gonioctena quinquepunctata]|nr:hypothetical protein JTB14_034811 [Gonioctena quinquepunctata]
MFPMNRDIFTDEDFSPVENRQNVQQAHLVNVAATNIAAPRPRTLERTPENILKESLQKIPEPCTAQEKGMKSSQSKISLHGTLFVELMEPVPGCSKYPTKKGRVKQHSDIFTSTPMKAVMEEKEKKKQDGIEKKKKKGKKLRKLHEIL